jgi:addiction module HigA family antidote
MPSIEVSVERRLAAPHPGPIIKRDFVDAIGLEVPALAAQLNMDEARLRAMLEGRMSIDVDAAIRFARGLQLPAERIMQMQIRADFSAARRDGQFGAVAIVGRSQEFPFPAVGFIRGRLGRTSEENGANASFFFQEDISPENTEAYAGLHALWRGDRLRVLDGEGNPRWTGPVLQNLDGRTLLPFVSATEWQSWFAAGLRADLAIGPDHAQFFARMRDA